MSKRGIWLHERRRILDQPRQKAEKFIVGTSDLSLVRRYDNWSTWQSLIHFSSPCIFRRRWVGSSDRYCLVQLRTGPPRKMPVVSDRQIRLFVLLVGALLVACPMRGFAVVHGMAVFYEKYTGAVPEQYHDAHLHCLALNVYHEARGEPTAGKFAVAAVTMNRVKSAKFPNDVCSVVWQRGQFSWTKDGRSDIPREFQAWQDALWVAALTLEYNPHNPVGEATYFHSVIANPKWAKVKRLVTRLGRHYFYAAR